MAISSAVDPSAVARVVGIKTTFRDLREGRVSLLPQRIAVVGQGSTSAVFSTNKAQVTSAKEVGENYGFGSPLHLVAKELFPVNGNGVGTIPVTVYPLEDDGGSVAATGDITPSGAVTKAGSFRVNINEVLSESFAVNVGDTVADIVTAMTTAINANLDVPVVASDDTTKVGITVKWQGASANDVNMSIVGPDDTGVTFAFTQVSGGSGNPDVDAALNQFGDVWETLVINCMELTDSASLNKYSTFGETRWGALTRKPLVAFTGTSEATLSTLTTIGDARKTDRTNAVIPAPGSNNLPFVIAAAAVNKISRLANSNPAHDYGSQQVASITAGTDAEQWNYTQRDVAIKAGISSIIVKDNVINLADTVTFYHPTGEVVPAYRYVVDIVKLQNIIYNVDLIFNTPEWDGAPLIPNDQPTTNRDAKKPSMAIAAVSALIDNLGMEALIADPATAKTQTQAEIDSMNPKRLNILIVVQLSGNTNIISIDLDFGFFFGTSAVVA
tara:strand:- start:6826 stop:8322 length:1497 start_codon:yes stop_codon:yes gene_type:complete